jgi:hypothetical protein
MSELSRSDRLARTKDILGDTDVELAKHNAPKTVLEQMRKSALADLKAELTDLAELLGTTKHRLVFIGQVGVGKTTAICHLVGLTAEREKRKATKAGPEKTVLVTEDLMATGSGFTTLCEVVVTPGEKNKFGIDPYPREEVERTIADFCFSIWKRAYPDVAEAGPKTGEQANFPPELVRAVRNMVKLPEGEKRDDDAAVRLAREFPTDGFDQFQARVMALAKLDGRTEREFVCPDSEADPRAWIKKTFDDLNLARRETVSIPKRITLSVDSNLLAPQMADIATVVDTKGVDAAQFNREDLDRYIRDDKGAVCILAEGFDTAPTNAAPLLQRHVTPELPMSLSKFALMVIPRGAEPEKVVGGQGPVGDRDVGIGLRRSQIEETLTSRNISGLSALFFDPLRHFEAAGTDYRRRSDSEPEEVQADRDEAWAAIRGVIRAREERAWERATHIGESLKKIKDGKGLDPHEEGLVRTTKEQIREHRHIDLPNADRFMELYRRNWEGPGCRHLMTLRATNNRFGEYPYRNIDVYYDARPITEALVRAAASRRKEAVVEIVRSTRESSPPDSDLRELFAVLETRIETSFEAMVRDVAAGMQTYLHDTALAPQDMSSQFWVDVQAEYGKGPGYRDRVLTDYADAMEGHEEVLRKTAEASWQRIVIDPVLEYLG